MKPEKIVLKVCEIPLQVKLEGHSAVFYKNQIIIFGRNYDNTDFSNKVYTYNTKSSKYSQQTKVFGTKPDPMDDHTANIDDENGIMLVFGGAGNDEGFVYALDLKSWRWSRVNNVEYQR